MEDSVRAVLQIFHSRIACIAHNSVFGPLGVPNVSRHGKGCLLALSASNSLGNADLYWMF